MQYDDISLWAIPGRRATDIVVEPQSQQDQ